MLRLGRVMTLWGVWAIGLMLLSACIAGGQQRPPRFVDLRVAGIDLLHASGETLQHRFGRPQTIAAPDGTIYRFADAAAGYRLDFTLDSESGAIRQVQLLPVPAPPRSAPVPAQVAPTPSHPVSAPSRKTSAPPRPAPPPGFHLPRPLTGAGLSPGDPPAAVERTLGRPHRVERPPNGRLVYLYLAPLRPDGSLPTYRARYGFTNGRLDTITIQLGDT